MRLLVALSVLIVVASACDVPRSGARPDSPAAPAAVQKPRGPFIPNGEIDGSGGAAASDMLDQMRYTPNSIRNVRPGQSVLLTVKNAGSIVHNVVAPELGVQRAIRIDGGKTGSVTLIAPTAPGTYPWWCNEPGHAEAGMIGEIVVTS